MNGGQIEATHNALVVLRTEVDALTKQNAELLAALECINVYVEEWGIKPGYTTSMYMVLIQDTARAAIKAAEPVKATSGFLNQRLRTEAQAKADRDA